MKKINLIITALFLSISFYAIDLENLKNETRDEINLSHFNKSRVILETGFGSASFVNKIAAEELGGKEIMKVNLVYTTYREVDDFDQIDLNDNRWENLYLLMPELKNVKSIELNQIGINSCDTRTCAAKQLHGFIIEYKKELFGYRNLGIQNSTISTSRSNTVNGMKGTKLWIPANAFVDANGAEVVGEVNIQLREALSPEDIVAANLLTVTDKDEALQSGGMVQIMAYSNGRQLHLKNGKEIIVDMPMTDSNLDMKVWKGEWDNGVLKWGGSKELLVPKNLDDVEPVDVVIQLRDEEEEDDLPEVMASMITWIGDMDSVINTIGIHDIDDEILTFEKGSYSIEKGLEKKLNLEQAQEVNSWLNKGLVGNGLTINWETWGWRNGTFDIEMVKASQGFNLGWADNETTNTFAMSGLGWANIDRLATFPNSKIAKLEIDCVNDNLVEHLSISLLLKERNIYLPGYKMKSGNYCFSHGDFETRYSLPIGDEAFLVLNGEKDGKDYSEIKKITIGKNEVEETKLIPRNKQSTMKMLKKII